MRASRLFWAGLCAPAMTAALIVGCGDKPASTGGGTKSSTGGGKMEGTTKSTSSSGEKTPVEGKGVATLKGKVVYDGTPPTPKSIKDVMEKVDDKDMCLKGDTNDPTAWVVGADKGVANVVVWIKAPEGKFLATPAKDQAQTKKVTIDQPHCAFEPHVVAFDPTFYDPTTKKQKSTGGILEVLNSAPKNHNTQWSGNKLFNSGANKIVPPKGNIVVDALPGKADSAGSEDLVTLSCDIHKWMTGKVAVFDHPFFAVTNGKGEFEIKDIPAGSEVVFCVWHESMGPSSLKGAKKETVTLKEGENVKEVKIK